MRALCVLLALSAPPAAAESEHESHWWAERLVCLPNSALRPQDRCGNSRIGAYASQEECAVLGRAAWEIEEARLIDAGWGGIEMGPVYCVWLGPTNVVS